MCSSVYSKSSAQLCQVCTPNAAARVAPGQGEGEGEAG